MGALGVTSSLISARWEFLDYPFPFCLAIPWQNACGCPVSEVEQHVFDVTTWPENPVVEHGGSLWLNCSTSCQEADAKGGLETSLIKEWRDNGTGWAAFQLVNITEWASATECSFSCYGEHKSARANIVVYQIPEQVALDPVPVMEVGRVYNLTCWVANVAPIRNLTVTLHKGKEKLHEEAFEMHGAPEASDVVVAYAITVQQEDHRKEVTCHATLDLRPHGPLLEKTSLSKVLRVFVDPQLHASHYVEADSNMTVQCDVVRAFPVEEAQFDLTLGEERLNTSISVSGAAVQAQTQASSLRAGNHTLTCTVSLGPVTKSAVEMVQVYSFPEPSLEIHPPQTLANSPVTITCDAPAFQPSSISLQLKNASGKILASGDQAPLQFNLKAQEEDDGREFICQVELTIGGDKITKRTSANLTVFYVPGMDESTCPSSPTWVEGTPQVLHCMAKGNPKPSVICTKDGLARNMEREEQVNRSHAGLYNCTATSELGSSSRTVTVHVEYEPQLDESNCPSNQTWLEGSLQKLSCQADGIPVAEVSCMKDGNVYDTRKAQNVTQNHAGVYRCNATNPHGSSSRMVTIQVEYEPEMDDSSCPQNWTWTAGEEQMFTCFAWGNPEPVVECTKDGIAYTEGVPTPEVVCTKDGMPFYLGHGEEIPIYNGTLWCNATNRHGTVAKTIMIAPKMDETSCPSNQTWLEGTLQALTCKANGTPTPLVFCMKEGATEDFRSERNVSRNDSGLYRCKATNGHGTESWMVNVQVEYRPVISTLAVSASLPIRRGDNVSITCQADGSPAASYTWKVPQASNLNYASNSSTVSIVGADGQNSGVYECTARNKHGRKAAQNILRSASSFADHWLYIVVVIAIAGATMLVLGGMAGVIYYLKSTACKKGEYNVRDAENSTEATCLNRERPCDGDIYGIQLTRT
uniref:Ig-like domain-containing protein n=1 Tax=Varanus komodoensis TaxID=61221 RepID=A0A8D2KV14_VARKO